MHRVARAGVRASLLGAMVILLGTTALAAQQTRIGGKV